MLILYMKYIKKSPKVGGFLKVLQLDAFELYGFAVHGNGDVVLVV